MLKDGNFDKNIKIHNYVRQSGGKSLTIDSVFVFITCDLGTSVFGPCSIDAWGIYHSWRENFVQSIKYILFYFILIKNKIKFQRKQFFCIQKLDVELVDW